MEDGSAGPGDVLSRVGETGNDFYLLLDGRVAVAVPAAGGRDRVVEAGPGSILGELALLRGGPRSATVTAITPCRYLRGDRSALDRLLDIQAVRPRLRRLASTRLAEDLRPVEVTLPGEERVLLRPLLAADRHGLEEALRGLSRESIRSRFFTATAPSPALIDHLVDLDYVDHFAWTALDPVSGAGMAAARYVRRPAGDDAEVAFTTADAFHGRGLGTCLLGALGVAAAEAGIGSLVAHVLEDNAAMRAVFAKAGAVSRFEEPGILFLTLDPVRAAGLLAEPVRAAIAASVHDVVTAASLALAQPAPRRPPDPTPGR